MSIDPKYHYAPVEILVAEDSPTQAQKLRHTLEQNGYRVTLAANGALALKIAQQNRPTLIISDVLMPEMDGYELCRSVKNDTELTDIPVILVTTLSDPQDVVRGLECRADNFILKPYDERYLLNRVQFVLVNREMRHSDQPGIGIEIVFNGERHFITADRLQILNLLLSTYEAAIQRNNELTSAQDQLQQANSALQRMTLELEDRVLQRTQELENTNEALRESQARLAAQLTRMNLLQQITRAVGERQDLQSIFQVVIRHLEDHLSLDFACICFYEPATNKLTISTVGLRSSALALELAMPEKSRIDVGRNGLSRCVAGELMNEGDLARLESPLSERLVQGGLRSMVAAPLQIENEVFSVLIVARRQPMSFDAKQVEFLRQLCEHVALAAHQAQLHESLQNAYNDLRQTQQAARQQERLLALGQIASGVAHDINNAISPVALYTESLLEKEPNLTATGRACLETIQRAVDDVAATVARLREFYREREPESELMPIQLNSLVPQVVDLTRGRWSDIPQQKGIVVKVVPELDPELPPIFGEESEIRQSLINLIMNAADAMPEGGILTVRTKVHAIDSAPPVGVQLEVSDTGVGMDEDTRRRCLEPFFTSKGERGTGLGLATVYGMAERHHAQIDIESAPNQGTTIRLSFPASESATRPPALQETVMASVSPLRILIIDDDPLILGSLGDALEADGHIVVAANEGQEGINAFRASIENNEPFSVAITDLGMPYVDGRQVASAVKALSPSTPVILFTGWGQRLVEDDEVPPHVDLVLNKPPKLRELRKALARVCQPSPSPEKEIQDQNG